MRRRVKEQLKTIGGMEFYDVNLNGIITNVTMDYDDGYTYEGHNFYSGHGDRIDIVYDSVKLEPLTEVIYHAVIKIPSPIVDDEKPIKVKFKVDGKEQILMVR